MERWEYQAQSQKALEEGAAALPGTKCPYSKVDEPWRWSSWLAGHYDTHGVKAWELAGGQNTHDGIKQWIKDNLSIVIEPETGGVRVGLMFEGDSQTFTSKFIYLPEG